MQVNLATYLNKRYLLGAVLALVVYFFFFGKPKLSTEYEFAEATRGDLEINIAATGTVEPEQVIDVGAQVAGLILSFGKDTTGKPIDYGSEVDEGTILAQIDDSLYLTDVSQSEAQLKRAKAELGQAEAKLTQAERDWQRAQKIGASDALSQSSYDSYRANFEVARASVDVSRAGVVQADAALQKARRNLGYTVIHSPVKGVIIDRRVNIGQTVVSSLNAPSLFLIAKDLRRMQVWVSVNEADIGNIHPGQKVSFAVDAFPDERFIGEVGKIRLNASMNQNVVTYVVEVVTDNSSGRLLPYLTANVRFEIMNRENVILVPNTALRWSPAEDEKPVSPKPQTGSENAVWILESGHPRRVPVVIGGTDGVKTEIRSGDISPGAKLIIGAIEPTKPKQGQAQKNPFAPTPMGRGSRRF